MLEPIALPTARPSAPLNDAIALTTNSGNEVPKAMTVIPINIIETPNCLANVDDTKIRRSALTVSKIKPTNTAMMGNNKAIGFSYEGILT